MRHVSPARLAEETLNRGVEVEPAVVRAHARAATKDQHAGGHRGRDARSHDECLASQDAAEPLAERQVAFVAPPHCLGNDDRDKEDGDYEPEIQADQGQRRDHSQRADLPRERGLLRTPDDPVHRPHVEREGEVLREQVRPDHQPRDHRSESHGEHAQRRNVDHPARQKSGRHDRADEQDHVENVGRRVRRRRRQRTPERGEQRRVQPLRAAVPEWDLVDQAAGEVLPDVLRRVNVEPLVEVEPVDIADAGPEERCQPDRQDDVAKDLGRYRPNYSFPHRAYAAPGAVQLI